MRRSTPARYRRTCPETSPRGSLTLTWNFPDPCRRRGTPGTVTAVAIGPMVTLTTAANPFAARILAAHLGAEGIVWELRGNVDGPYPVGPVEILVAESDLEVAREIVTEQAVADHDPPAPGVTGRDRPVTLWVLLVVVVLVALVTVGRLLLVPHGW